MAALVSLLMAALVSLLVATDLVLLLVAADLVLLLMAALVSQKRLLLLRAVLRDFLFR
ncbi:hypothetical protein PF003_g34158 [Phytophthora fragariae]|nr:hypothetical protein PF003_g34158 [Phytophthora fragariae]